LFIIPVLISPVNRQAKLTYLDPEKLRFLSVQAIVRRGNGSFLWVSGKNPSNNGIYTING